MSEPSRPGSETLGELGENATLARIFPHLSLGQYTQIGPGDDGAVLTPMAGNVVLSCDTMFHGPDFRLAWSTGEQLGIKAMTSNIADIVAMGAEPRAMMIAIGAPQDTPVQFLEDFAAAVTASLNQMAPGVGVVGGDLTHTRDLSFAVTVIGEQVAPPILRSGARVGDTVALWGKVGYAATGIRLLFDQATDAEGLPDQAKRDDLLTKHPEVLEAQLAPTQDFAALVKTLASTNHRPTSMLDVSDGLTKDALRISAASGNIIQLNTQALAPLIEELSMVSPYSLVQNVYAIYTGGEDHPMLATFASGIALPEGFVEIGVVSGQGIGVEILDDGQISSADEYLEAASGEFGWDAFTQWDGRFG